jgi:3-dehydroquinate dehydratase/shikimate dehydrogenase
MGENAVYCPLQVNPSYESLKAFLAEVLAKPWLGFHGFSVTLPHKENALRYIRETGGPIDPLAERIGAVNTLTVTADGNLAGHNTDCAAALAAVQSALPRSSAPHGSLAGLRVSVLGAGGVARAVVTGLVDARAEVTLFNRTEAKARSLARTLGCRHMPWNERGHTEASLLVNCTPVGLWPAVHESPMPAEALTPGMSVFDTVYHPVQTTLIRDAARRGCATIDGLSMFALQAQAQFARWTGHTLPPAVFRQAAEAGLDPKETPDG